MFALTTGSMFMCSFGAIPSQIVPAGISKLNIKGLSVFTVSNVLFTPFGTCCSVSNPGVNPPIVPVVPCTPIIVSWSLASTKLKISGQPALNMLSTATCAFGGIIKPISNPNSSLKAL